MNPDKSFRAITWATLFPGGFSLLLLFKLYLINLSQTYSHMSCCQIQWSFPLMCGMVSGGVTSVGGGWGDRRQPANSLAATVWWNPALFRDQWRQRNTQDSFCLQSQHHSVDPRRRPEKRTADFCFKTPDFLCLSWKTATRVDRKARERLMFCLFLCICWQVFEMLSPFASFYCNSPDEKN